MDPLFIEWQVRFTEVSLYSYIVPLWKLVIFNYDLRISSYNRNNGEDQHNSWKNKDLTGTVINRTWPSSNWG